MFLLSIRIPPEISLASETLFLILSRNLHKANNHKTQLILRHNKTSDEVQNHVMCHTKQNKVDVVRPM